MRNHRIHGLSSVFRQAAAALVMTAATTAAFAAPYAINYTGQAVTESGIGSNLPGAYDGQYNITLVFDNGGTTPFNQTWNASHLRCVIWHMRRNGSTVFQQNLRLHPAPTQEGAVTTDGSGTLTSVFTKLAQNTTSLNPGDYTFVSPSIPGGPPDITPNHPYWFIPNSPGAGGLATYSGVFYIGSAGIDDVNGGVSTGTNTTGWAAPVEFTGTACAGQPLNAITAPSTGTAAPVPALGTPALVLLALAASGLGTRRLRQRKASA